MSRFRRRTAEESDGGEEDQSSTLPKTEIVVPAEFDRNAKIGEIKYSIDLLDKQRVVIVGANSLAEEMFKQLLVFGFRNINIWSDARDSRNRSLATGIMKRWNQLSPFYRNMQDFNSLESMANTASFDELGFAIDRSTSPTIMINTVNNHYLSDILAGRFLKGSDGLFVDAHTISNHSARLYGMNIQTMLGTRIPTFDRFDYLENRDLSVFEGNHHDPLMSVICASYVGAIVSRFALSGQNGFSNPAFMKPASFTLFPFTDSPDEVRAAEREVRYNGFFGDKNVYLAGLGGGSLCLDLLVRLFDIDNLIGVDRDRLDRSNFNRLIPFVDERLIGKKKTEAAKQVYRKFSGRSGKNIRFVDGVIADSLLIGKAEESLDLILGMLSGFDNKMNLASLSQRLAKSRKDSRQHALIDIGVEPFRVDVTPYILGATPCDHCRNIYGQAVTDYIANNIPNCDRFPVGSTIFANYLGASLALVQAMKYFDRRLGNVASHSVTANLFPDFYTSALLHQVSKAADVDAEECNAHCTTSQLVIREADFEIVEGKETGWHVKDVYAKVNASTDTTRRHLGRFKYIPRGPAV